MNLSSLIESITERLAVAFVSAIACALTLVLFPIVLAMIGRGGGEFEFGVLLYSFVFSKTGLLVVIGGAVIGFCLGAARMANILSFFWGTHSFWDRAKVFLDDKLSVLQTEHSAPTWLIIIMFVALASFFVLSYA